MNKKLAQIKFVFENCEVGTLPIGAVPGINLYGVTQDWDHYVLNELQSDSNLDKTLICKSVEIIVDANQAKDFQTNFSEDYKKDNQVNKKLGRKFFHQPENMAERLLAFPDIVSLTFIYLDGNSEEVYVPYESKSPDDFNNNNILQRTSKKTSKELFSINDKYKDHDLISISIEKHKDNK